jgi:hypothetical protein
MEGQALLQILLICVLLGYGAGITTAFMFLNTAGRGYSGAPVVVESRDGAGCALGLLALLGGGAFLVLALLAALAQ